MRKKWTLKFWAEEISNKNPLQFIFVHKGLSRNLAGALSIYAKLKLHCGSHCAQLIELWLKVHSGLEAAFLQMQNTTTKKAFLVKWDKS